MAFGERSVFSSLSCDFPRGKITVVLGGSGTGKSTVLRLVGGLVRPQSGSISVGGQDITTLSERELYGVRRDLGMTFQNGALLDSLSVFDNVAFPLREHARLAKQALADEVHERLAAVGLSDVDELLPRQLSGGMVKRVALARAMILKPSLVLCDEPFSGLDPLSVKRIEQLFIRINRERGMTMIVVSHDVASTMRLADHVVMVHDGGAIEGTPAEMSRSAEPRVAEFFSLDIDPALLAPDAVAAAPGGGA